MPAERTFVLVANRADPSGEVPLDDLAGKGGRFDLVTRFVTASLLTSHGIRSDTDAIVLFTRRPEEPVALRIRGAQAVGLRPDERSTAARLNRALKPAPMPVWQDAVEGIASRTVSLASLMEEVPDPVVLLAGEGQARGPGDLAGGTFVIGDQDGLEEEQRRTVKARAGRVMSVGPVALQADQVVTVVHNLLDRREAPPS